MGEEGRGVSPGKLLYLNQIFVKAKVPGGNDHLTSYKKLHTRYVPNRAIESIVDTSSKRHISKGSRCKRKRRSCGMGEGGWRSGEIFYPADVSQFSLSN